MYIICGQVLPKIWIQVSQVLPYSRYLYADYQRADCKKRRCKNAVSLILFTVWRLLWWAVSHCLRCVRLFTRNARNCILKDIESAPRPLAPLSKSKIEAAEDRRQKIACHCLTLKISQIQHSPRDGVVQFCSSIFLPDGTQGIIDITSSDTRCIHRWQ